MFFTSTAEKKGLCYGRCFGLLSSPTISQFFFFIVRKKKWVELVRVLFTKLTARSTRRNLVVLTENSSRDAHDRTRPSLSSVSNPLLFFFLFYSLLFSLFSPEIKQTKRQKSKQDWQRINSTVVD